MFTYDRWRVWLKNKATEFGKTNITARFASGPDEFSKPGMVLELAGNKAIGIFENWITGETDYTIYVPPGGPMVSHRWGLEVSDDTFESIFDEFVAAFHKHNVT